MSAVVRHIVGQEESDLSPDSESHRDSRIPQSRNSCLFNSRSTLDDYYAFCSAGRMSNDLM